MELKIQLIRSKKTKTTTEIIESSSTTISNGIPSRNEEITTAVNEETELDEITSAVNEIPSRNEEITTAVNEETELDEITPFLNQEISHQLVQEIIDELKADKDLHEYLNNIFPDDVEMFDSQYILEEEPY